MSALARYFVRNGYAVAGYDRTPSELTRELEQEGILITYSEQTAEIPAEYLTAEGTLVVRTPAVPAEHAQYVYFREHGYSILKRAEVLGMLTRSLKALCVSGTHGKTTTSTLLAHLLHESPIGVNAFLGGISRNYHTNLLTDAASPYVVVEADEYDRSFHHLSPHMAIITAADPDHLDIYGTAEAYRESFAHFTSLIQPGGVLLMKAGVPVVPRLAEGVRLYRYAAPGMNLAEADFYADNVEISHGQIYFDFHTPNSVIAHMQLGVPAWVNIENATAALAIAWLCGLGADTLAPALASFRGVERRFAIHYASQHLTYIDDYAHHPEELRATITSVRRLFPERRLVGIFQPHLFTRTRDFYKEFAEVLSLLDEVILMPIYPARELPIEGITSEIILERLTSPKKCISPKEELIATIDSTIRATEQDITLLTLGAGDIDRMVTPITELVSQAR